MHAGGAGTGVAPVPTAAGAELLGAAAVGTERPSPAAVAAGGTPATAAAAATPGKGDTFIGLLASLYMFGCCCCTCTWGDGGCCCPAPSCAVLTACMRRLRSNGLRRSALACSSSTAPSTRTAMVTAPGQACKYIRMRRAKLVLNFNACQFPVSSGSSASNSMHVEAHRRHRWPSPTSKHHRQLSARLPPLPRSPLRISRSYSTAVRYPACSRHPNPPHPRSSHASHGFLALYAYPRSSHSPISSVSARATAGVTLAALRCALAAPSMSTTCSHLVTPANVL